MRRIETYGPAVLVLATAAITLVATPLAFRRYTNAHTEAAMMEARDRLSATTILEQLNQATRDLATIVEPSVVHISTAGLAHGRSGTHGFTSSGSGWIYDEQGHIVTNAHVVDGANSIEVQLFDGERREAKLVAMELRADIAVLKIDPGGLHPAMRTSEEPKQGDLVYAFGSPFDFRFSMSSGIVSGIGRTAGLADVDFENFIQVDAAINPGNSGGPLTDTQGRVIGMSTAIATGKGSTLGQGQSAGIGLAIPMDMIDGVVTQIIQTGSVERGYLGVQTTPTDQLPPGRNPVFEFIARTYPYPGDGAVITSVTPGSPAESAGLRVGDVIQTVAGVKISSRKQIFAVIGTHKPGSRVKLEVWRPDLQANGASKVELEAALARMDPAANYAWMSLALRDVGVLKLSTATEELCRTLGVAMHHGVLVEEVRPGSLVAKRLPAGSIITEVGGQSVASLDDFYTRVSRGMDQVRIPQVTLTIIQRDGEKTTVQLPLN